MIWIPDNYEILIKLTCTLFKYVCRFGNLALLFSDSYPDEGPFVSIAAHPNSL